MLSVQLILLMFLAWRWR